MLYLRRLSVDYALEISAVQNSYRQRACRRAVFFPILGDWSSYGDEEAIRRVQALWRQRLAEFRDEGWKALDGNKFQYARNCPPFGIANGGIQAWACNKSRICPFCWGRDYAYRCFRRIEDILYGGTKPGLPLKPGYKLLEFVYREDIRNNKDTTLPWNAPWGEVGQIVAYNHCQRQIQNTTSRCRELRYFKPVGGFVLHTVLPNASCTQAHPNHLQLRRSGILVLDAAKEYVPLPDSASGRYKITVHDSPCKRLLAEAVGRVCSYPGGMLTCPVGEISPLLTGFARVQMVSLI
jgi:hypothetical protein